MMKYKGYTGYFNYDEDVDIFHRKVPGIRDVITFRGRSLDELKFALHEQVVNAATITHESLNTWITEAVKTALPLQN